MTSTSDLPSSVLRAAADWKPDHQPPPKEVSVTAAEAQQIEVELSDRSQLSEAERAEVERWMDQHDSEDNLVVLRTEGGPFLPRVIRGANILEIPQPGWLVDDLVPFEKTTAMIGNPSCGKSFLALDLALSTLTERDWGGRKLNPDSQRGVLWLAGEGVDDLAPRASAWCDLHGFDPKQTLDRFDVLEGGLRLHDRKGADAEALLLLVQHLKPQLVVVDTLAMHVLGSEETNGDFSEAHAALQNVARTGCAVLVVHHSGKDATKAAMGGRGGSTFWGAIRSQLSVSKSENTITAKHTKSNNSAEQQATHWKLTPAGTNPVTGGHLSVVPVVTSAPRPVESDHVQTVLDAFHLLDLGHGVAHGVWKQHCLDLDPPIKKNQFEKAREHLADTGVLVKGPKKNDPWRAATDPTLDF